MRLWIDASIPPSDASYHDWAMNCEDAIEILRSGKVSHVSIAYSVEGQMSGHALLLWMRNNRLWPRGGVHIHGGTKVEREAMLEICRSVRLSS